MIFQWGRSYYSDYGGWVTYPISYQNYCSTMATHYYESGTETTALRCGDQQLYGCNIYGTKIQLHANWWVVGY